MRVAEGGLSGGSFGYFVGRLGLDFEVEMERVDHVLHGSFAFAPHEGAALAGLFVVDYLKGAFEGCDFLHVGLAGVFGRYIDHYHHNADEHREPVAGEEVA